MAEGEMAASRRERLRNLHDELCRDMELELKIKEGEAREEERKQFLPLHFPLMMATGLYTQDS